MIYTFNGVVLLIVCFLLSFALTYDRKHIRRAWKPVLILLIIEQGVLAFGSHEAKAAHVHIGIRQKLLAIVIVALMLAIFLVLATIKKPNSWWYKRDDGTTPPDELPRPGPHCR